MTKFQLFQFIRFLRKKDYRVFGPVYIPEDGRVVLKEIGNPQKELDFTGRVPYFSFKDIVFPACHELFRYKGAGLEEIEPQLKEFKDFAFPGREEFLLPEEKRKKLKNFSKIAILMVNFVDLRALGLYNKVYENDVYYQALKDKILIVGANLFEDKPENNHWGFKYSREFLTHCPFDIFLELAENFKNGYGGDFNVLTGSQKGKDILAEAKIKPEYYIDYAGPELWGDLKGKMDNFQKRMERHYDEPIWKWLGERCVECGQCALVCPTCFCFDINDRPTGKNEGIRERYWNTCFYANFSEVGAAPRPGAVPEGFEFLNTTAKKIHFWYFHKFGRIPKDYNIEGCVGCGRCSRACPVDINLAEVMKLIEGCQGSAALVKQKSKSVAKISPKTIMKK